MTSRLLLVVLLAGCGGSSGSLDSCATGWWLDPASDCSTACPGQPECSATDCRLGSILGLLSDHTTAQAFITSSVQLSQLSALGSVARSKWSVSDDRITITEGGNPALGTCTATTLDIGINSRSRAAAGVARALDSAAASGNWSRVAVPP